MYMCVCRVPTQPGKPGKIMTNLENKGFLNKKLEKYFETWKNICFEVNFQYFYGEKSLLNRFVTNYYHCYSAEKSPKKSPLRPITKQNISNHQ